MIPALDRNTIKTTIRGAYEIDAWARGEPIDVYEFETHGRRIGREGIWRVASEEFERIHSTKLYTLDAFGIIIATFGFEERVGSARPATDALVSILAYNTGDDNAPIPHTPGARYEGDVRIEFNRPWNAKIIERQRRLLEEIERDEPGITKNSSERARAAYRWVRETL